ncbi:hypothetical protein ACIP93_29620 [Streptomyces sp. NPDC088745]|uniref:hypothetical protein n=1 Tax=Streptomyces sp. NPDC088745 TaxID=3365884 RepID=UPI003822A7CA
MSDDINKASADALAAARQSEQFAMMLAAVEAARVAQPPACQHPAPAPKSSAGKYVAMGAGASVFMVALALSAVAVAISAVALTVCVLVLRSVWADMQKDRD